MVLPQFQLKKIFHWTSKGTLLVKQIDRVSMGSPIVPLLGDVCISWVLDQILNYITQPSILI